MKLKCKKCGKSYDSRHVFTNGYKEFCYECGYVKATEDFQDFEQERFQSELQETNPDFSDFDYDDIEGFI